MWQRQDDTSVSLLGLADDKNSTKHGPKELTEKESPASIRRLFGNFGAFDRKEGIFD